MKKILQFTLISCLIFSLILILMLKKNVENLQNDNLKLKQIQGKYEHDNKRDIERYSQMIFSENVLVPNICLQNSNFETIDLATVMDKKKLMYRFYEDTCWQCVEDELAIVKQLEDSIGSGNIIIISSFGKMNKLKAIIKRKKIISPFYIYKSRIPIPIEADQHDVASFFVLDRDLRTRFVYMAGGNQSINDAYYKRVISYFKYEKNVP